MFPSASDPIVSPEEARTRIEAARPSLAPVAVTHLGRGWDHDVYLANGTWVVRFPRNAAATRGMAVEAMLLPWLSSRLSLPIPQPAWITTDQIAHPIIRGQTICEAGLDRKARAALGSSLGAFVRALHEIPPAEVPVTLPGDLLRRLDPPFRVPETLQRLASLRDMLGSVVSDRLQQVIEQPPTNAPTERPTLVHADLHVRNLLVDSTGAAAGVIDWVDVHVGQRALDLAVLFEVLPPEGRPAFLRAYGTIPLNTLQWARWRATDHLIRSASGTRERGDTVFASACLQALRETAED